MRYQNQPPPPPQPPLRGILKGNQRTQGTGQRTSIRTDSNIISNNPQPANPQNDQMQTVEGNVYVYDNSNDNLEVPTHDGPMMMENEEDHTTQNFEDTQDYDNNYSEDDDTEDYEDDNESTGSTFL